MSWWAVQLDGGATGRQSPAREEGEGRREDRAPVCNHVTNLNRQPPLRLPPAPCRGDAPGGPALGAGLRVGIRRAARHMVTIKRHLPHPGTGSRAGAHSPDSLSMISPSSPSMASYWYSGRAFFAFGTAATLPHSPFSIG